MISMPLDFKTYYNKNYVNNSSINSDNAVTYNPLCLSIAVFLHLFFLCAFGWMLAEGLYMYILVTKVSYLVHFFDNNIRLSDF